MACRTCAGLRLPCRIVSPRAFAALSHTQILRGAGSAVAAGFQGKIPGLMDRRAPRTIAGHGHSLPVQRVLTAHRD